MQQELAEALARLDPAALGHRIKQARIDAGLTQPEAAGESASAAYLSRIERGERKPGVRLLEALCANLSVSVEQIILGEEPLDLRAVEVDLDFAELAMLSGDADSARRGIEALLNDGRVQQCSPLHQRAVLVSANAQAALGHNTEAIASFEELIRLRPSAQVGAQAALGLSRLLREVGDLARSAAVAEAALESLDGVDGEVSGEAGVPPGDTAGDLRVRLSVTLAAALYEAGKIARALTICRQAVALSEASGSPGARAAAYWNTAVIESESGRLDEALRLTRKAMVLLESQEDARLNARLRTQLGELLLRMDPPETAEALKHLEAAQEALEFTSADVVDVLHNRMAVARARFASGDEDAAERDAEHCLSVGADLPFIAATSATLLGRVAARRSRMDEAREHYLVAIHHLSAIGADRRAAQLWFNLASLLDGVGLHDEAKDAFRRSAVSAGLDVLPIDRASDRV